MHHTYQVILQRGPLASLSSGGWFVEIQLSKCAFEFDETKKSSAVLHYLHARREKGAIVDGIGVARISDGNAEYFGGVLIEPGPLHSHYLTLDGEGTLVWFSEYGEAIYRGNFDQSLRNGFGKMHYSYAGVYTGEWLDGTRHGFGTLQTKNASYVGSWYRDQRKGYGEQTYKNGNAYTGYWDENPKALGESGRSGAGIMHYPAKQLAMFKYDEKVDEVHDNFVPFVYDLILLEHAALCASSSCRFGTQCKNMKKILASETPQDVPCVKELLRAHASSCLRRKCWMPMCCAFAIKDAQTQERQMCTEIRKPAL